MPRSFRQRAGLAFVGSFLVYLLPVAGPHAAFLIGDVIANGFSSSSGQSIAWIAANIGFALVLQLIAFGVLVWALERPLRLSVFVVLVPAMWFAAEVMYLAVIPAHFLIEADTAPEANTLTERCAIDNASLLPVRTPAQPVIQANWWSDPTMIPPDWDKLDRREKADFILNGRTIPGGPPDMRYFFYDYRASQIDRFVRETAERVKRINPKMEVSAAVFKNPILSSRFIGQHWDRWNQWIDVYMPMTYRSHFAGSFDAYLDHLTETTERQLEWIGRGRPLYAGIATTYLFREELQPFDTMRDRLAEMQALASNDVKGRSERAALIRAAFDSARPRLGQLAPAVEKDLTPLVAAVVSNDGEGATSVNMDQLAKRLAAFRADIPAGFLPTEKLTLSIRAARKAKPDGIAIFAAGSLNREKMWSVLETEFKE